MRNHAVCCLLILGTSAALWGQTSAELGTRYRRVVSFEVRPAVVITPRYTADGQVCEMFVERRHGTEAAIDLESYFEDEEVETLVDELVPEAERGENLTELAAKHPKSLPDLLNTTIIGRSFTTRYTYENVLIRVYGVVDVADLARRVRGETIPLGCPERSLQCAGNMVIRITWRKRTCAEDSIASEQ